MSHLPKANPLPLPCASPLFSLLIYVKSLFALSLVIAYSDSCFFFLRLTLSFSQSGGRSGPFFIQLPFPSQIFFNFPVQDHPATLGLLVQSSSFPSLRGPFSTTPLPPVWPPPRAGSATRFRPPARRVFPTYIWRLFIILFPFPTFVAACPPLLPDPLP